MADCREVTCCRVCSGGLETVLDLKTQCLGGQFPGPGEPDPPAFPLVLARCQACGLAQLRHTVNPELMFRRYGYRSGVTATMTAHLAGLAGEAVRLLGRHPDAVLDVGGNDGTLASCFGKPTLTVVVDPSDVPCSGTVARHVSSFFPCPVPDGPFDLVFSVACFYDADDPVGFARAARDNLAPTGLWCVEVSDWNAVLGKVMADSVCHEHLCYYAYTTLSNVAARAGLREVLRGTNDANGGSLRVYYARDDRQHTHPWRDYCHDPDDRVERFKRLSRAALLDLRCWLYDQEHKGKSVHLLGASTKANTLLQAAGAKSPLIRYASDRDPRKRGRRTPGTGIPIVSEEESRALKPDAYLVGPYHFREEIVARERAAGFKGKLVFPLPSLEVIEL